MKKHSARSTVGFVVFLVLLGVSFLYVYMYTSHGALVSKTLSSRKVVKAAEMARLQSKEILKLYEETSEARAGITSFFVKADSGVTVIQAIEAIGASSGATVSIAAIHSVAPDPEAEDKVGAISASVTATGSWDDVMKALELVETLPYKSRVGQVALAYVGQAKEGGERRWQLSFDLTVSTI